MYNLQSYISTYLPCILILSELFYLPTDAQLNCLKTNFKIHVKIEIKAAPTYFGLITNVTLASSNIAFPDDGDYTETCRSCFNVNFNVYFKIVFKAIQLCISW
jgi:hypothetical protein